jgi:2-polyprenyl-6-methoxyphenol hydroxylase-like FAD-dependent oxidoreductase
VNAEHDVVVVGARCAGAATAMLLARAGHRVALVDRAEEGADALSTHALMRAGVVQLQRWGLLDRLVAAGTPAVRRTVFHYGERTVAVPIEPLYAPRRTVLDPLLVDAAREAGAEVAFGVSVTGVETAPDGRVIGVAGHDEAGREMRLRARVTVGADGGRSTVARAVGAPVERAGSHASAFVYAHVPGVDADGYEWFYGPGVTAGLIPTNDGRTCAWIGVPGDRFRRDVRRDVPGAFRRVLAEVSPTLAARVAVPAGERLRSFPGAPGFLRTPWGPGWALAGDAGYWKDPITAHGMSDALRDAELVARAVGDVLGGAPEAVALGLYHRTRNRLSDRLLDVTDRIASYEWDTVTVEPLLRELSASMAAEVEHLLALDDDQVLV